MARLTLSEQVNAQASQIAELTAQLHTARETVASHLSANHLMQGEVDRLRKEVGEIPALREQIAKLTKERDDAKNSLAYQGGEAQRATNEIEQAHAVLDGVDGAPPRTYRRDDSNYDRQRNVVTRLAGAFLAIAKNGGAK